MIDWLLDSDPALRWQVLRDLLDAPPDEVEAERARVGTQGWGARLLALQDARGHWDGGTYRPGWVDESKPFFDAWTATTFSLQQLRDFGLDPASLPARTAIARVRENVRWDAHTPFFAGETEPCVNGMVAAIGAYFGENVDRAIERLVSDALPDGGWNCWAEYGATVSSFNSTIGVLDGLLAWEKAGGTSEAVTNARRRGEEYLLERGLLRRRSNGRLVDPRFTMLSYPNRWYYDVLRALEHFRSTGLPPDPRCAEAVELVASKRDGAGPWMLENTHQGPTHFDLDAGEGRPSRWVTLRALRVVNWWEAAGA